MLKKIVSFTCVGIVLASVFGCKKETLPKPSSQLSLEYPMAEYAHLKTIVRLHST